MKREPLHQAIASWKMKLKAAQNELNKKPPLPWKS